VTTADSDHQSKLPALVFVHSRRDGASRKMESLVAWIKVTQKKRLRVVDLDAERSTALAERLRIRKIPSLLLVKDRRVVGRIEGRATGRQIEELIRAHL
jgi:thioredoxin-like negative regulator of GroEL